MIEFLTPPKKWDFKLLQDGLELNGFGMRDKKDNILAIVSKRIPSYLMKCASSPCDG